MNSRPKDPKTARNKNVLVIGGSGSGKTRFWLKPNLMQMHSSYVVTDPKGTILVECGKMLQRGAPKLGKDGKPMKDKHGKVIYEPYRIKVLNTINFKKSMHYNPFAYIHSEKDILKLVTTLIANTKGEGKAGDDFWVKAETLLYCALIGYIHYEAPVEEQNFSTLIEFINAMEVREDDEEFKNPVDLMFDALEAEKPNHFAVRQYKKYKLAAGKTAKSILISCGARLAVFDIAELREVTAYDELELDTLGDRKTALFLIMSDTDDSFNFLISMCYTQLFNLLCEKADDVYGGRLPVHVRCLIDECANIGQIPKLEKLVATIRSREISACLVLQGHDQLDSEITEYRRSNMEHLPKKIHQNGISYTLVGDYYIPDLELPEESRPIGRWGRMHKAFLQEHRPGQYNALLLSGKLWTYLADLNEQAADRLACIVSQMQEAEGVTEELKARDQLAWVGGMNSIRSRAEEIILSEMIFV